MKKISTAELKRAIIAAEARRATPQIPFRRDGAKLQKTRLASERLISDWMRNSGFDEAKFRALKEQREREQENIVARHKADALRQAARSKNRLHAEIAGQSQALHNLARASDFFPYPSFSLDKPFLIWPTPNMAIESSAASFDSWAKFKFRTSASEGVQKVSFYFYWVNPYRDYAVIDAATFLSSVGHLKAHASWGFTVNSAEVLAWAEFGIWFGVQNDLNAGGYEAQYLGRAGALSTMLIGSNTSGRSVSFGSSMSKSMFAVPAGKVAVFEVAVALNYDIDDGDIEADFESGDFRIACPVVVFSLLNSPSA